MAQKLIGQNYQTPDLVAKVTGDLVDIDFGLKLIKSEEHGAQWAFAEFTFKFGPFQIEGCL